MSLEQWRELNMRDPWERGPRAYFSGTGVSEPQADDYFLEEAVFDVDPEHPSETTFSHPWLGTLVIQDQSFCVLTLSERTRNNYVRVSFHDKGQKEKQSSEQSVVIFIPGQERTPLVYYFSEVGSLHVEISTDLTQKPLTFSFYGLTERVQGEDI